MLLEKAAFTAKQRVEFEVVQSIETAVWKASNTAEQRKMYRFLFPKLRKATEDMLSVTRDVDSLSHSIEAIRGKKGYNTTAETSLRELHRAFLNLTQILLDHFEAAAAGATEVKGDQHDVDHDDSTNRLRLLELVLALSHRAHQLSLAYHWPLYQRLAIVVAKHPTIIEENIPATMTTTLGSLESNSRAEWIQTIQRWSRVSWGSGSSSSSSGDDDDDDNGNGNGNDNQRVLQTKHDDLEWFHPSLKVLAVNGRWSDVWHILTGLLRPEPVPVPVIDPIIADAFDYHYNRDRGFCSTDPHRRNTLIAADDYDNDSESESEDDHEDDYFYDDTVVLSSTTIVPYLDEDLVLGLLLPMHRQGLLKDLWDNGGDYPPPKSVEETCDIILMMEASIWNIFGGIPVQTKANISNKNMKGSEKYNLQDAIGILMKYGPKNMDKNNSIDDDDDDGEEGEYFLDDDDKYSLTKALKDLGDLLDEQLDAEKDEEGENDGQAQQASDAIALATVLSNQIRREGALGNQFNSSGGLKGTIKNIQNPSDKTEIRLRRSGSEHIMEMTNLNNKSHHSTEDYLKNVEEEDYLDLIYEDRAVDYKDNIPDIASQIYQNNGNQELRYTASVEHHIYEGMQRSPPGYDSEDDDELDF